jgi:hypothetical protein
METHGTSFFFVRSTARTIPSFFNDERRAHYVRRIHHHNLYMICSCEDCHKAFQTRSGLFKHIKLNRCDMQRKKRTEEKMAEEDTFQVKFYQVL